jgi:hypothetical protein
MRIDIKKLIKAPNSPVKNFSELAKILAEKGKFKNKKSAYDMIRYNESGKAGSID